MSLLNIKAYSGNVEFVAHEPDTLHAAQMWLREKAKNNGGDHNEAETLKEGEEIVIDGVTYWIERF